MTNSTDPNQTVLCLHWLLRLTETASGTIVTSKTSYVGYIYPFFTKRAGLMVTVLKLVTLVFAIMTLICKLGNRRDFFF